ncbi:MAG: polysaccharide deacetylase family protein [Beijerinckiaceae bacterium]|jgi:allantoinase|nr:polysaccharide deacetylase family protein [Beijerinckiaceae bacterium]
MRPEDRLPYRASIDRPPLALPDGKAVACWFIVNVENWLIDNPMPRQVLVAPTGAALQPDIANWAWHEYGMRAGFWRLLAAFEKRGIRPTLSINGSVCLAYPRIAGAAHEAGWEFMGHGFVQVPTHRVEDQRAMIGQTVETIRAFTGKPCIGWLGPGLTETLDTPDHLAEAGIRYIADWVVDDRPCRLATRHGTVLTMPYTVELNDIPTIMIQHHPAEELGRRALRTADRLAREAKAGAGAKVMSIAIHPYITGVPHRIDLFETLLDDLVARGDLAFLQGCALNDWYLGSDDDT